VRATLAPVVAEFELIFVNDGSEDESWSVIKALSGEDPSITGINLMHNYGQHNALLAGILTASHPVIVTMDDDLQHPPEELPKLLEAIQEGYDVAYGKPVKREHTLWRNLSSRLIKGSLRVALGADMAEKSSAFRAFRRELRKGFARFSDAQVSIDVLLSWTADRVACVEVEHHPRKQGRSGYSLRKLIGLTLSMVTGYSTVPLRVASSLGLLSAGFGLTLFIYVVIKRLLQEAYVPGFTFLAAAIALFAGLQLFTIGVIGEYLARVHFRTMGKPPYVIRERTKE
jgi:undecaprenyl-phosphate 4-deoxy-4-formamido-L-arabinose transferase